MFYNTPIPLIYMVMAKLFIFYFSSEIERIQRPDITLEEIDLDTVADTKQLDEFLNN